MYHLGIVNITPTKTVMTWKWSIVYSITCTYKENNMSYIPNPINMVYPMFYLSIYLSIYLSLSYSIPSYPVYLSNYISPPSLLLWYKGYPWFGTYHFESNPSDLRVGCFFSGSLNPLENHVPIFTHTHTPSHKHSVLSADHTWF